MHTFGQKYSILAGKGQGMGNDKKPKVDLPKDVDSFPQSIKMTREEAVDWVHKVLERSGGP